MNRIFKIRCSAISKIMGSVGLSEKQELRLAELLERNNNPDAKPLTPKMLAELKELNFASNNLDLPQTCKSYLHEWYADEDNTVHSKYLDKGLMCESECIQFMAQVLEFGIAEKNKEQLGNEFITGSCDVNLPTVIVDCKCPWDKQTFQENVFGMDKGYIWQGIGYCILFKKLRFILFYGLMDTDESLNFGEEVIYSDLPDNERWIAYEINFTQEELDEYERQIIERVKLCREYLIEYDKLVKSKTGKLILTNPNK